MIVFAREQSRSFPIRATVVYVVKMNELYNAAESARNHIKEIKNMCLEDGKEREYILHYLSFFLCNAVGNNIVSLDDAVKISKYIADSFDDRAKQIMASFIGPKIE